MPFIYAFGGAERLILDLSKFLHHAGVPHVLSCFRQTIDLQSYADWPLQVHQILPTRNSFAEARALYRFSKSTQMTGSGLPLLFDLKSAFYAGIVSAGPFSLHLTDPPSLLAADISKYSPSARRDCEEFDDLPRSGAMRALRAELVHRLNRRGVGRAARVIVMTEKIRKELQQLYAVDSLVVRPGVSSNGIDRKALEGVSKNPLRMLSVSRLESNKRIDWILHALAALDSDSSCNTEWTLEIVGEGPACEPLKQLAKRLELEDRTLFLGHVSDAELRDAYSRASLFMMPAAQGYGLPALEALSRGIPAIVHRDSGVSEILDGNPWVEVVGGESESVARAIRIMMDRVTNKTVLNHNRPAVPKSSDWAKAVCNVCGWI
jgi:glycosyltransferase involved in cell wall biosynthesis